MKKVLKMGKSVEKRTAWSEECTVCSTVFEFNVDDIGSKLVEEGGKGFVTTLCPNCQRTVFHQVDSETARMISNGWTVTY